MEVEVDGLGKLTNHIVAGPQNIAAEYGAPAYRERRGHLDGFGGDWEFRGVRAPIRT